MRRFAEANAGIKHDLAAPNPRPCGDVQRPCEEIADVADDVERRVWPLAVVHDDDGRAVPSDNARHIGIALQTPDIVHDPCPFA